MALHPAYWGSEQTTRRLTTQYVVLPSISTSMRALLTRPYQTSLFASIPFMNITEANTTTTAQVIGLYIDNRTTTAFSQLCLGCVDTSAINTTLPAPIEYLPLRPNRPNLNYWQLSNASVMLHPSGDWSDPFDTVFNSTLDGIYAPLDATKAFYAQAQFNGTEAHTEMRQGENVNVYTYPCDSGTGMSMDGGMPLVMFTWGKQDWMMQPEECVPFFLTTLLISQWPDKIVLLRRT